MSPVATERDAPADAADDVPEGSSPVFGAAQRVIESSAIAVATSTGLYLVGSVYTDAYFARLSIEVTSLDLAPPFIALQSAHVLESLLEYPIALLFFYLVYRVLTSRTSRGCARGTTAPGSDWDVYSSSSSTS